MSPLYNFAIQVRDAEGGVCSKDFELTVGGCSGLDWINDPTIQCRLRIKNYSDGLYHLAAPCAGAGSTPWDGTFSVRHTVGPPTLVTYDSLGLPFNEISGFVTNPSADIISWNSISGKWSLSLQCSAGAFWQGAKAPGTDPVGVYLWTFDAFSIGNITIEAYHL